MLGLLVALAPARRKPAGPEPGRQDRRPGAAIMDAAWPKIADGFMKSQLGPQLDELNSLFSRFDQPPGGQYDGWYQYFDRDIRRLLGSRWRSP